MSLVDNVEYLNGSRRDEPGVLCAAKRDGAAVKVRCINGLSQADVDFFVQLAASKVGKLCEAGEYPDETYIGR